MFGLLRGKEVFVSQGGNRWVEESGAPVRDAAWHDRFRLSWLLGTTGGLATLALGVLVVRRIRRRRARVQPSPAAMAALMGMRRSRRRRRSRR